jgi:hypothetical protein
MEETGDEDASKISADTSTDAHPSNKGIKVVKVL